MNELLTDSLNSKWINMYISYDACNMYLCLYRGCTLEVFGVGMTPKWETHWPMVYENILGNHVNQWLMEKGWNGYL